MTLIGAFTGNDPSAVTTFENWLGADLDFVRGHGGKANWTDYVGSLGWIASQFKGLGEPIFWSVPLIVDGASLSQGATGAYNQYYVSAAKTLLANSNGLDVIHVRVGEEFNGNWFPWAANGKEGDFIATFHQFVDSFRSVSDKFVFEWNVNIGDTGMDPATAYPGDKYVDIVGMDFYWNTAWDPKDPATAWNYMVTRKYGLQWLEDFAKAHGKPTAYSEWGVNSDNAGVYIAKAAAWFASHNVQYQSYWDSDAAFQGKLSSGQYAATGHAFIDAFGAGSSIPGSVADSYAMTADGHLVVSGTYGVLANDGNASGLSASLISGPSHGTLKMLADGSFTYVPDAHFTGTDGFVYAPVKGNVAGANTGVSIKVVAPQPEPPVVTPPTTPTKPAEPPASGAWQTYIGGTAQNDTLTGDDRNNQIDGSGGSDLMTGGKGDDSYGLDVTGDRVVEKAGEGIDTVTSYASSYLLPDAVENLTLVASYAQSGTGNALSNLIIGGAGDNTLDGKGGNDWMTGGGGRDTFVFEPGSGHDVINDFATGSAGDAIDGKAFGFTSFSGILAAMTVSGTVTTLQLSSDASIDFMGVSPASFVAANFALSTDTTPPPQPPVVTPPTTPTKPAEPPASGAWQTYIGGTARNDTLTGDDRNNQIDGSGGSDLMTGGKGDDSYGLDVTGDRVVEKAGEGIDTVSSYASSYLLPDAVENLTLVASYAQSGTGNALSNRIIGGAGDNTLNGKGGNDWMTGGGGHDIFVFGSGSGHDVITDFQTHADRIDLRGLGFASFTKVSAAMHMESGRAVLDLPDGSDITLASVTTDQLLASHFLL